jgi:hypothetical protein
MTCWQCPADAPTGVLCPSCEAAQEAMVRAYLERVDGAYPQGLALVARVEAALPAIAGQVERLLKERVA